jgi:PAB-dependent poly(A)-specific ribonuclease subunit 2
MSISATAAYMAFGDAEGVIHLLSQAEEGTTVPFNGFDGHSVEWADNVLPLPLIEWTSTT